MKITETKSCDSRVLKELPTQEILLKESLIHIKDVDTLYNLYLKKGIEQVSRHDFTKVKFIEQFYQAMYEKLKNKHPFTTTSWWHKHITLEKHHCLDYKGNERIDLLDVIEMLTDWVAASKARGTYVGYKIDDRMVKVLLKAVENTLKTLDALSSD